MKTQKPATRTLPSPIKFSFYLIGVTVFCFLNWTALRAADNIRAHGLEQRLAEAIAPVADPEPEIEDWMLTAPAATIAETEIALEEWMLTPNAGLVTESEIEVEEWMVNTESWNAPKFLAKK
jgi:hypothetical protein